jgi:cold shock CspA family protein
MEKCGTIKVYQPSWGFISQDNGPDLFFRRSDFEKSCTPQSGQRVSYHIAKGPRGLRAVKVRVLDAAEATWENWFEFIHIKPIPRKIEDAAP